VIMCVSMVTLLLEHVRLEAVKDYCHFADGICTIEQFNDALSRRVLDIRRRKLSEIYAITVFYMGTGNNMRKYAYDLVEVEHNKHR